MGLLLGQVSEVNVGSAFFHVNQYQTLTVPDQSPDSVPDEHQPEQ